MEKPRWSLPPLFRVTLNFYYLSKGYDTLPDVTQNICMNKISASVAV
jgi:hypothetical protein